MRKQEHKRDHDKRGRKRRRKQDRERDRKRGRKNLRANKRRLKLAEVVRQGERAARRAKEETIAADLTQTSHREQFLVNLKALEHVGDLMHYLKTKGGEKLARESAAEVKKLLLQRQQTLRVADAHGWEVAARYGGESLARGDTEKERKADDKKIMKALQEAKSLTSSKKSKTAKRRQAPVSRRVTFANPPTTPRPARQTTPSFQGNCNKCGRRGHKAAACTTPTQQ